MISWSKFNKCKHDYWKYGGSWVLRLWPEAVAEGVAESVAEGVAESVAESVAEKKVGILSRPNHFFWFQPAQTGASPKVFRRPFRRPFRRRLRRPVGHKSLLVGLCLFLFLFPLVAKAPYGLRESHNGNGETTCPLAKSIINMYSQVC